MRQYTTESATGWASSSVTVRWVVWRGLASARQALITPPNPVQHVMPRPSSLIKTLSLIQTHSLKPYISPLP